jgi:hypothetical protein
VTPQQICDHVAKAITALYHEGGRYFVVPNLPPLGDKPNYLKVKAYHDKANDTLPGHVGHFFNPSS